MSSANFYRQSSAFCALLYFCVLMVVGRPAHADPDDFFSFGMAGGSVLATTKELESNPPLGEADFNGGYSFKASLAILLAQKIQLEAEYLYTFNIINSLTNPPTVTELTDSDLSTHSLMLNATYRIEVPSHRDTLWTRRGYFFYFGGGIGVSQQDYSVENIESESDSSIAWQVLVGFEKMNSSAYLFSALPSPFLQYRFLHLTEGDFGAFKTDASLHIVEFGFRFYGGFGS